MPGWLGRRHFARRRGATILKRRALVTGATGGLGLALVAALVEAGYEVRATGRRAVPMAAAFMAAELTDPAAIPALVAGMDVVFHAAALSSPWGKAAAFRAINVDATRVLLDAAQAAGCENFVFISTPSVYAEPRDRLGLTEASPVAAVFANDYAATKYAAERLVLAANAPGFATMALRPRALVGPDDAVLLPRILQVARRGWFPMFNGGRALIELTDVRDAAAAAIAADARREEVAGRVFNISGGAPARVRELLELVFTAFGLQPKLVNLPFAPTARVLRAVEFVCARLPGRPEPPATVYSIGTLAFCQTFDLSAAREALGWAPRFTPQEAIARTARAWRGNAAL